MRTKIMIIIFSVFFVIPSKGHAKQWNLDKAHSEIRFEIKHIYSTVSGLFADFSGDLTFDPDHLESSGFEFKVNIKSINTHNTKRDTHLRGKDFFRVDKYPVMLFKSSKISHVKDNLYELEGELTIKNVVKPIKIQFTFDGPKQHPFEKKSKVAGFNTAFEINRLDYGVGNGKFYKMGVVDDMVKVVISVEALSK